VDNPRTFKSQIPNSKSETKGEEMQKRKNFPGPRAINFPLNLKIFSSAIFLVFALYVMGKHSHRRKIDTTPQTTGGLVLSQVLFSSFDSIDAEYFAIVTHAVDSNQLRIFDARNNTVKKSYTSEKQERFTCMSWGQIQQPKGVNGNAVSLPYNCKQSVFSCSDWRGVPCWPHKVVH